MAVTIEIEIDTETGQMTTEINGMQGPSCDKIADEIKKLAGQPAEERKKQEYYASTQVKRTVKR